MLRRRSSAVSSDSGQSLLEQWRCSRFDLGQLKNVQITASALDMSTFAVLTRSEDPALAFAGQSNTVSHSIISSAAASSFPRGLSLPTLKQSLQIASEAPLSLWFAVVLNVLISSSPIHHPLHRPHQILSQRRHIKSLVSAPVYWQSAQSTEP